MFKLIRLANLILRENRAENVAERSMTFQSRLQFSLGVGSVRIGSNCHEQYSITTMTGTVDLRAGVIWKGSLCLLNFHLTSPIKILSDVFLYY